MKLPNREILIEDLKNSSIDKYTDKLISVVDHKYANPNHGHFVEWEEIYKNLPSVNVSSVNFEKSAPNIGLASDCDDDVRKDLKEKLLLLKPWRKGPFDVLGIYIDAEWRSDFKWSRISPHIDISNKVVLDIGCGNGYYMMRMMSMKPSLVLGVEPSWIFNFQYNALKKYFHDNRSSFVLPLKLEDIAGGVKGFDTVFSMGILYHRKDPSEHLNNIYDLLNGKGELILETLIIEDQNKPTLIPKDRYANMRNVWIIPNLEVLQSWLSKAGFRDINVLDKSKTSIEEQRQTEWMESFSLEQALEATDRSKTIEGYPAPVRVVIHASK